MLGVRRTVTRIRYSRALIVTLALSTLAFAAPAAAEEDGITAAAPTLRGSWAPLNRCPVDNPAMPAATGTTTVASFVSGICDQLLNSPLNAVTATVRPAGEPSDFDLGAGLGSGAPIVTLPIKIQLSNPFLGSNCFVGSNANPIVLHPANLSAPTARLERFNPDGTPSLTGTMISIVAS